MKLPLTYHNRLSYVGTLVAALTLTLMFIIYIVASLFNGAGHYTGLLLYVALPIVLFIGLMLIPLGMFIKFRKNKRVNLVDADKQKVIFDFNNTNHRNAALVFVFGTFIFIVLTSVGSYEAFHYTESNEFCGTLCHKIMTPEYTTYQTSSHAKVKCVACHVGEGADFYAKSKITGLYQVYAAIRNIYPRPIPTPISSLSQAHETCEQCHWPQKFYTNQVITNTHYLTDSLNTEWTTSCQMKIGPAETASGSTKGIHWHINKDVKIEYIESDSSREFIPWVKYTDKKTGKITIFQNTEEPLAASFIKKASARTMDCMDCHNRPSHQFLAPQNFIDKAISKGDISKNTPQIKSVSMQILKETYPSYAKANANIKKIILDFYKTNYPSYYKSNLKVINKNIAGISKAYAENVFPEMGANWDKYPKHDGHLENNGCFRCHDDKHKAKNGKVISKACDLCHSIVKQGDAKNMMRAQTDGDLEFKHPIDIGDAWKESNCSDCHRYLY